MNLYIFKDYLTKISIKPFNYNKNKPIFKNFFFKNNNNKKLEKLINIYYKNQKIKKAKKNNLFI